MPAAATVIWKLSGDGGKSVSGKMDALWCQIEYRAGVIGVGGYLGTSW